MSAAKRCECADHAIDGPGDRTNVTGAAIDASASRTNVTGTSIGRPTPVDLITSSAAEGFGVALDWHMLGPAGEPDAEVPRVPMGEDAHGELFARVGLHRPHHGQGRYPGNRHRRASARTAPAEMPLPPLPLLARAADYYEDAAYAPAEVPKLLAELTAVAPRAGAAAQVVSALSALCREAEQRGRGIVARAD